LPSSSIRLAFHGPGGCVEAYWGNVRSNINDYNIIEAWQKGGVSLMLQLEVRKRQRV
jgi:hypothetical protein